MNDVATAISTLGFVLILMMGGIGFVLSEIRDVLREIRDQRKAGR